MEKAFIFSQPFDQATLGSLYEEDYQYVAEVFSSVLSDYDELVGRITQSYQASDLNSLKSAVHKIKPLFGYVGLLKMQEACQQFESFCQTTNFSEELSHSFQELHDNLLSCKALISGERQKLDLFNRQ